MGHCSWHGVVVDTKVNDGAGQARQACDALVALYVLGPQLGQAEEESSLAYEPMLHAVQEDAAGAPLNVPGKQGLHVDAPGPLLKVPGAQKLQVEAVVALVNVPGWHMMQVDAEKVPLKRPCPHAEQTEADGKL